MQISVAPNSTASFTRRTNSSRVVLVGVGGAPALAEAAEGAAHHADVGDVDVAVHHERHQLAGQLRAQLVGRLAHVLDRLGPRLGEQRRQLVGRELHALARPCAIAPGTRSRWIGPLLAAPRAAPRDEAPVLELDHVEHALLEPLGVHVLRVHAEPLGERVAARRELLAHPVHRRERVLRRDVVAVGRQPAEVGGALVHQRQPPVAQVRRDLDADAGQQPLRTRGPAARMSSKRYRRGPVRQRRRFRCRAALCALRARRRSAAGSRP